MTQQWLVTFTWAGHLGNVPQPNGAQFMQYQQLERGYIEVDMLCSKEQLLELAAAVIGSYSNKFNVQPFFVDSKGVILHNAR